MQGKEKLWILAIIAALLFAFAFIGVPVGLGAFLFFNFVLFSLYYISRHSDQNASLPVTRESQIVIWIFGFFYVLLTLPYLYRMDSWVTVNIMLYHFLYIAFMMLLVCFPALLHILDPIMGFIYSVIFSANWLINIVKAALSIFKLQSVWVKFMLKVIAYGIASLIVFIVFASLLSQADAHFKDQMLRILELLNFGEIVVRTIVTVVVLFIFAGLFKMLLEVPALKFLGISEESLTKRFAAIKEFVYTRTSDAMLPLLISLPVLLIFTLFVYVQFRYLFGVDVQNILKDFTFSQYARRGFGELIFAVILTYPLLGWIVNHARSRTIVPRALNYALVTGIVACVFIMLYSAFVRMSIYTDVYGPSVRRNYVYVGITLLGLGMIVYEVLALAKTIKPDFSFIKSYFIGDFTVLSGIVVMLILSVVALYPWNQFTLGQIVRYYRNTGNLDVYQIIELPDETAHDIYVFANDLENENKTKIDNGSCVSDPSCPSVGIRVLKAHTLNVKDEQSLASKRSVFNRVFGLNYSRILLLTLDTPNKDDYIKTATSNTADEVGKIIKQYIAGIENNDFAQARSVYDPKMVSNNLVSFAPTVNIVVRDPDTSKSETVQSNFFNLYQGSALERSISVYYDAVINRLPFIRKDLLTSSTLTYDKYDSSRTVAGKSIVPLTLTIGLRNGKAVLTQSNLVLSYLPDAIVAEDQQNNNLDQVIQYGYGQYCKVPDADYIFAGSEKNTTSYSSDRQYNTEANCSFSFMQGLTKQDFVIR